MTSQTKTAAASLVAAAVIAAALPVLAQKGPAPEPVRLPPEILSLACAPKLTFEAPPTPIRVTGSQESIVHRSFAPGDLITINAGSDNGVEVGQEYYTRRAVPIERRPIGRDNPATIRTPLDRHGAAGVVLLARSEEHTSELQSLAYLVCRLLLEKKKSSFEKDY